MSLSLGDLEEIEESQRYLGLAPELIAILIEAINDWPTEIHSLDDYVAEVCKLVGTEDVTRSQLAGYWAKLDVPGSAWRIESLNGLSRVFNYYEEGILLKEIIKDISAKVRC